MSSSESYKSKKACKIIQEEEEKQPEIKKNNETQVAPYEISEKVSGLTSDNLAS